VSPPRVEGVGVHVEDLANGSVVLSHEADAFRPSASLGKLLTAFVALKRLGPSHRAFTELHAESAPRDGTLASPLYLRGGGDVTLVERDLAAMARRLRAAGVRRIEGPIVADPGVVLDTLPAPAGPSTAPAYRTPITGLLLGYGTVYVGVKPCWGFRPRVSVPFGAAVTVDNRSRYGLRSRGLKVEWHDGTTPSRVVVTGTLAPWAKKVVRYFPAIEGPTYAGRTLRHFLREAGIELAASETVPGMTPTDTVLLDRHEGRPLTEAIRLMNKNSINAIADALVKTLGGATTGRRGTYEDGLAVLRADANALGLDGDPSRLVSGSGLRRDHRVRPRDVVRLLRAAWNEPSIREPFFASLPVLGTDGTLREHRPPPPGARLVAKTGTVRGIAALAGLAEPRPGTARLFAIIVEEDDPERARFRLEEWERFLLATPSP
jgi:D-alanyl-D-alanine carboxypeptidase/D-alanyl-D-alanine-endopeptidase (penicillin-binding protein 4)